MLDLNGILFDNTVRNVPTVIDGQGGDWTYGNTEEKNQFIKDSYKEAAKEIIKDEAKQQQKFDNLVKKANKVFLKIETVFPFDFFPTTVAIDPEKVTIQIRNFFASGEIRSIHIKNVSHIFVDSGPFFSTLNIIDQSILDDEVGKIEIPYLKKEEALRARRIIQGLIITNKENIDVLKIPDKEVVNKIEEIGRMQ